MTADAHTPFRFKDTEIGPLPAEWKVDRVGQVARITTGARNTQDRVEGGAYPFFVRSQQVERINSFSYDGEAVLTAGDGVGTGKVFHYIVGRFDVHQRVYRISDFSPHIDGRYFFYQFSSRFYDRVISMTAKSSVDSVRLDMITEMEIPVPPLPEQHAIASALSDIESLIAYLDALIAKKRAIKQGAMQQLLTGRTRLPGFEKKRGNQQSVVGIIPNDWKPIRIGDLFVFKNGLNKAKEFFGAGTPIVNYLDVFRRSWIRGSELEGRVTLSRAEIENFLVQKGDVFFTRTSETSADIATASVVVDEPTDTVFSGFILRARPKFDALDESFKKYCFQTRVVREQVVSTCTETTRALTSSRLLSETWMAMPPRSEQAAIAGVLSDMDEDIDVLERRLEKAIGIKQGMMQSLLSGRIRLLNPVN
jgi:type I restriction enzyme S subunit